MEGKYRASTPFDQKQCNYMKPTFAQDTSKLSSYKNYSKEDRLRRVKSALHKPEIP